MSGASRHGARTFTTEEAPARTRAGATAGAGSGAPGFTSRQIRLRISASAFASGRPRAANFSRLASAVPRLMTARPKVSGYCACHSATSGRSARQGPHAASANTRTRGLSGDCSEARVIVAPSRFPSEKAGAGVPGLSPASALARVSALAPAGSGAGAVGADLGAGGAARCFKICAFGRATRSRSRHCAVRRPMPRRPAAAPARTPEESPAIHRAASSPRLAGPARTSKTARAQSAPLRASVRRLIAAPRRCPKQLQPGRLPRSRLPAMATMKSVRRAVAPTAPANPVAGETRARATVSSAAGSR